MSSIDIWAIFLQASRVLAFLMCLLAFVSGFKYKRPWRVLIFTGLLICYGYLLSAPTGLSHNAAGAVTGNPHFNPPTPINLTINFFLCVLFWRNSGADPRDLPVKKYGEFHKSTLRGNDDYSK